MGTVSKALTNYKVVHVALACAALTVALLRNHGVLNGADVDALVAGIGALGIGLNVNLTGNDRDAVVSAEHDVVEALQAPAPAADAQG